MTIGELLKKARLDAGMTQKELAEKCGMADSAIRKYESGKVIPKIETRKRIATALNITTGDLMSSLELMSENFSNSLNKAVEMIKDNAEKDNKLLAVYHSMNDRGQEKAFGVIEDLAKIPEYQQRPTAPVQSVLDNADDNDPTEK